MRFSRDQQKGTRQADQILLDAVVLTPSAQGSSASKTTQALRDWAARVTHPTPGLSAKAVREIDPEVAVLIPCFNEEMTVAQVISQVRQVLPHARIIVGDNASTDRTADIARANGAEVLTERRQGKGAMVRRMFRDVNAAWYLLVDGDATYDFSRAADMLALAQLDGLDLVNGVRCHESSAAYRPGHVLGNKLLTGTVAWLFGRGVPDMLSGFKVLSRRFVKSFPALSTGFDLETELAIHALELGLPTGAVLTPYGERPQGSFSKLSTYRDGLRILWRIAALVRHERPLLFFTAAAVVLWVVSAGLLAPVLGTYWHTGLVPRLPTAVLSMGLALAGVGSFLAGVVLDTVTRGRQELRMLAYLHWTADREVCGAGRDTQGTSPEFSSSSLQARHG